MDRYQLAKIVDWAGTLRSRKRMQKVVYLLQISGCPIQAEYILHHYGPYSQEVARLSDEMVRYGLLEETSEPGPVGVAHSYRPTEATQDDSFELVAGNKAVQYSYRLTEATQRRLAEYERNSPGTESLGRMTPFEERAKLLIGAELKELEIAATLVYFHRQDGDWSLAAEKTRLFKNLPVGSSLLQRAEALAKRVVS